MTVPTLGPSGVGIAVLDNNRQRWSALMETYFAMGLLTLGIQIVDIRHKPTRDDMTMAEWFRASGKPWVIIANKLDKIKKSQLEGNIAEIRQTLLLPEEVPVIPFSAEKGMGRRRSSRCPSPSSSRSSSARMR